MCKLPGNLVAWMDGELAENEAASVAQHVEGCAECRAQVALYRTVSNDFAANYTSLKSAAAGSSAPRRVSLWVPGVGAVAAAIALVFIMMPRPVEGPAPIPQPAIAAPAIAKTSPTTVNMARARRRLTVHRKAEATNWAMAEPVISIEIPADAMFPPGAVPEGVRYIASVSLAGDGSVQQ